MRNVFKITRLESSPFIGHNVTLQASLWKPVHCDIYMTCAPLYMNIFKCYWVFRLFLNEWNPTRSWGGVHEDRLCISFICYWKVKLMTGHNLSCYIWWLFALPKCYKSGPTLQKWHSSVSSNHRVSIVFLALNSSAVLVQNILLWFIYKVCELDHFLSNVQLWKLLFLRQYRPNNVVRINKAIQWG